MNRGQHRRPNAVINFLKKKPVYLSAVGLAAIVGVGIVSPNGTSHAATSLATYGSGAPPTSWGGTPLPNDSISGGKTLYPESGSTELPSNWQGIGPNGPAQGKMFFDHWGTAKGPSGQSASAWLEHYDVTLANNSKTPIVTNNGYLTIQASMIDPYISNIDGYQGTGGTQESQFDTFLHNEALKVNSIWSPFAFGGSSNTVYDLPNLIDKAGGAFTGQSNGGGGDPLAGPIFYWTYAPQARVSVPVGQVIKPGSTFNFDGEVGIMSYHSTYHWEWAQVVDSNGQPVTGATITFGNAHWGAGQGVTGGPVYLNPNQPQANTQMTEVNGGTNTPSSSAPKWYYWADGSGEPNGFGSLSVPAWSSTQTAGQYDTITLPSSIADGTYTIQFYASDYYNRVSKMATTTFTVGNGTANSGITLTENPASPATVNVGQSVTLTATVNKQPPAGQQWYIEIEDLSGSTINGTQKIATSATGTPTTFSVTATSNTPISNENFQAFLVDTTSSSNSETSNTVTATWQNGNSGGGGGGGGGACPAPYDSNEYWQAAGSGNEYFYWTYNVPTPVYHWVGPPKKRRWVFWYCNDVTQQMHQYYPASLTNGQISGLSYDPGRPGNMWLPTSSSIWATQATGSGFWAPMDSQHGWDWLSSGGPSASQVSGSYYINGTTYNSYGTGQGSTPWAWARPDSGFGFRIMWQTSPHSLPTGGNVTYTMTNSDGASTTWRKRLVVNGDTLNTQGTSMPGLNQPPPNANEYVSAWTQIPKTMSNKELAAWSLSGSSGTALADGAHISVTISVNTQNAGTVTLNVPSMVGLFNYPAWMFNQTKSVTVGGQTYTGTTPAMDGQP